jgi:phosphotriesterase-related protein
VKYGGHGYAHILENIAPKMKERGISPDNIHKILVETPRKWLTFI